jgi:hypothetical protein
LQNQNTKKKNHTSWNEKIFQKIFSFQLVALILQKLEEETTACNFRPFKLPKKQFTCPKITKDQYSKNKKPFEKKQPNFEEFQNISSAQKGKTKYNSQAIFLNAFPF